MAGNVKVMVAPGRYVQGQGAIFEIGRHVKKLGKKALVIGGKTGLASTREGRKKFCRKWHQPGGGTLRR